MKMVGDATTLFPEMVETVQLYFTQVSHNSQPGKNQDKMWTLNTGLLIFFYYRDGRVYMHCHHMTDCLDGE